MPPLPPPSHQHSCCPPPLPCHPVPSRTNITNSMLQRVILATGHQAAAAARPTCWWVTVPRHGPTPAWPRPQALPREHIPLIFSSLEWLVSITVHEAQRSPSHGTMACWSGTHTVMTDDADAPRVRRQDRCSPPPPPCT